MKHEDPYWRKAKIGALILKRVEENRVTPGDRRIASFLLEDAGVTNRLIDQAVASLSASRQVR